MSKLQSEKQKSLRKEDWETPDGLYNPLHEVFGFTIDLAASEENTKTGYYVDEKLDFTRQSLKDILVLKTDIPGEVQNVNLSELRDQWCWCNPPYKKKGLGIWVEKLCAIPNVVALLPASLCTDWFLPIYSNFNYICLIAGRVVFKGAPSTAPFESVLVIKTRYMNAGMFDCLSLIGTTIDLSQTIQHQKIVWS